MFISLVSSYHQLILNIHGFSRKQIYSRSIIIRILQQICHLMQRFIDLDSDQHAYSASIPIPGLEQPSSSDEFQIKLESSVNDKGELAQLSVYDKTLNSTKDGKKKLASCKSRLKKKMYLQNLEREVTHLTKQIETTQNQISKCKDKLLDATRISSNSTNQHGPLFAELDTASKQEDIDLDKINLLLDLIQNRIGANARERQANLDYNFKQIVNFMFPAMHRYFMRTAVYESDLFGKDIKQNTLIDQCQEWIRQIYCKMQLSQTQIDSISSKKQQLIHKRREAKIHIQKLKNIKEKLKQQQQIFETAMSDIRQSMNPLQSALITVFGQKNKLRRQFCILTDPFQEIDPLPTKKIKQE